jgi:hypothetical protein
MLCDLQQAVPQARSKAETSKISAESHMARKHAMILLFAMASGAGCHDAKRSQVPEHDGSSKVTFQVYGLMKAKSGAT